MALKPVLPGGLVQVPVAGSGLTADELAAINNANAPSGANVFATIADLPEGGLTSVNLSTGYTTTSVTVQCDAGTDATINAADSGNAGIMTSADKVKLDGLSATAILQVLAAHKSDTASVTGTTFTAITGLSQTITLAAGGNHVLIHLTLCAGAATSNFPIFRLTVGGTPINLGDAAGSRVRISTAGNPANQAAMESIAIVFLHTPGGVGPWDYAVEMASSSSGAVFVGRSNTDTDNNSFQRGTSNLILMEVAQP